MSAVEHRQAPDNPTDGDRFECPRCRLAWEFVTLDDGLPGEWVEVAVESGGSR